MAVAAEEDQVFLCVIRRIAIFMLKLKRDRLSLPARQVTLPAPVSVLPDQVSFPGHLPALLVGQYVMLPAPSLTEMVTGIQAKPGDVMLNGLVVTASRH